MNKCDCGDVFGFKLKEALRFIGSDDDQDNKLRKFVTKTGRGCTGRLTFPGSKQVSRCVHLRRKILPQEIIQKMDKGKYYF